MFCEVSQTSEEYKKKFSQFYFCTCKKNHFGCDVDVFIYLMMRKKPNFLQQQCY